jgi:cobalt/nickel transport protein
MNASAHGVWAEVKDLVEVGESQDGIISFATGRAGLWVLAYEATIDESGTWTAVKDDPSENYKKGDQIEYDEVAPTAYLTFWVND